MRTILHGLPAVVQTFYLQHTLQGWCPPLPVLRRLGFRAPAEIELERNALKALLRENANEWPATATPWQAFVSEQLRPWAPCSTALTSSKIVLTRRAKNAKSNGETLAFAPSTKLTTRW